ncbi:Protein SufA [Buchnera aphidicola (Cinara pseudotaxifoliae)]|uniref:Protein SufA n=1 Tax=Buchnera aphidicola (Cinara pseudotaxifoliae) TaxID=655384 RepID=A0A451DGE1_9GAMM|nr:iron-sulfur cluster assembly accessory protein [Buchnera aphidicola]VFP85688.1 Protein SufA [Buchnera aphidicola (Cinara pseudotaxifoliae)]
MNVMIQKNQQMTVPIQLTKQATKQILFLLKKNKNSYGIKITLKKSGCAGFKYILKLEKKINNSDYIYTIKSIKFFIPKKIISRLYTTIIDFSKTGLNSSFIFINKKHTTVCGCGESFNI